MENFTDEKKVKQLTGTIWVTGGKLFFIEDNDRVRIGDSFNEGIYQIVLLTPDRHILFQQAIDKNPDQKHFRLDKRLRSFVPDDVHEWSDASTWKEN